MSVPPPVPPPQCTPVSGNGSCRGDQAPRLTRAVEDHFPPPIFERPSGPWIFRLYPARHSTAALEPLFAWSGLLVILLVWVMPPSIWGDVMGPCYFHRLTGYPCVTCGATRSVLALVHGHLFDALRLNPLIGALGLAGGIYWPAAWVLWIARSPRPRLAFRAPWIRRVWWCLFLVGLTGQWAFLIIDRR